jgi:peptide/nickel transport system ATP-binding protein
VRRPSSAVGVAVVLLFVLVAVAAPLIAPHDPTAQSFASREAPSWSHWFGTDRLGRDVFSRVVYGARSILSLTAAATALAVLCGTLVGLYSGFRGGATDEVAMRVADALLAFPALLLALVLLGTIGRSTGSLTLVIVVLYTPIVARVVRSEVLAIKEQPFIEAARLQGESLPRLLGREILPSVLPALSVEAALRFSYAIFLVASLGFLGVGVQPPTPDWGLMVKEARLYVGLSPWTLFFPAGAISLLVIAVNLAADGLKDALLRAGERRERPATRPRTARAARDGAEERPASSRTVAVERLTVSYRVSGRWLDALRGISLTLEPGRTLGLVGESGSGKSTLAYAMVDYLADNGAVRDGTIWVEGTPLHRISPGALRRLRGATISLVAQDPLSSLNPSMRIGMQLIEAFHPLDLSSGEARRAARALLEDVQLADGGLLMRRFPHQLSGGMRQRIAIAMALAPDPRFLLLDEPTTGLDVTIEAAILDLLARLEQRSERGAMYISHDLALVARVADRVAVLYAGELVEEAETGALFETPVHPYTAGLIASVPQLGMSHESERLPAMPGRIPALAAIPEGCVFVPRCPIAVPHCARVRPPRRPWPHGEGEGRCHRADAVLSGEAQVRWPRPGADHSRPAPEEGRPLLHVEDVHVGFPLRRSLGSLLARAPRAAVRAVDGVDLTVFEGETLGLVGESGSGKTTLARAILGLEAADRGALRLRGEALPPSVRRRSRALLSAFGAVAQDPSLSLNPHLSIGESLSRPLRRLGGRSRRAAWTEVERLLETVGLPPSFAGRGPEQLSGGEKQRVAIARAFAASPALVVLDEPTSSLDVSVQAGILNLLGTLQREVGTAYLFITHDLAVVGYMADRIAVLYGGRLMEIGPTGAVLSAPMHPYTEALLASHPAIGDRVGERRRPRGEPRGRTEPALGCPFDRRCPRVLGALCEGTPPPWRDAGPGHRIYCHIPVDRLRDAQAEIAEAARRRSREDGG